MKDLNRREFLVSAVSATAAAGVALRPTASRSAQSKPRLAAGEGVVDITPPLGIEMGGFHRPPGKERRIKGIRQPAAVRALVLAWATRRWPSARWTSPASAARWRRGSSSEVARRTGIPAENVRVCATHTHSMPGFCYLRQWGAMPTEFMATVEQRTVEAIVAAQADLAPAELSLGKCRVAGGNHNRTTKQFQTDEEFAKDSTDAERWLDTMLHALVFRRAGQAGPALVSLLRPCRVLSPTSRPGPTGRARWPGGSARTRSSSPRSSRGTSAT